MKQLLFYFTLLITCGCQAVSQVSQPSSQTSTGCPEKPKVALRKDNTKDILLTEQTINISGQASADKSVGYTFKAESGQKLSYRTSDDICIWIYRPDTQLLSGGELPQTGTYTLQVSAPKGSTTFNLEMSLGSLQASQPSVPSSPSVDNPTSTATTESPSVDNPTSTATTESADLSQEQALELVNNWYKAKPQIFGPAFDRSLVEQYTTGQLYQKTLKQNGSIDWLRSNGHYYIYESSRITKVMSFSNSGSQPSIMVSIFEKLYLHGPKEIVRKSSGSYKADFIYFFQKSNGIWKIYDYRKIS